MTQRIDSPLTSFDHYIISSQNIKQKGNKRSTYKCFINPKSNCDFLIYSRTQSELQRFFVHLAQNHPEELSDVLTQYVAKHSFTDITNISCVEIINDYIVKNILSKQTADKIQSDFTKLPKPLKLIKYDLDRLDQIILERGIAENLPLSTIRSPNHIHFIIEFAKMGFKFGRNSELKEDEFIQKLDKVTISKNLLQQVGNDYFLYSIEPFRGAECSFQIDAGKNNQRSLLVFMLSGHQRRKRPMIFHIIQNFGGTLIDYRDCVKKAIEKAMQYNIEIVGIVTDNLPVQVQAFSQDSEDCFQKFFKEDDHLQKIVHFRCCSHLLSLAFNDWLKYKCKLTEYEKRLNNIILVFKKKPFLKYFRRKIPQICKTRWCSAFHTLQMILENRNDFLELFINPPNQLINDLKSILDDFRYLVTTGFTEVYPLLFPYLKLTYHLQNDDLSCVHAVLIIEHYINEMIANIIEYNISEDAYELINLIEKRLLLNKNVQLYQLSSLFTLDGIVRYRSIMEGQYSVHENDNFWHNKEGFLHTQFNLSFQNINSFKNNELNNF